MHLLKFTLALLLISMPSAAQQPTWLSEVAVPMGSVAAEVSTGGKSPIIMEIPHLESNQALLTYQQSMLNEWSTFIGAFDSKLSSPLSIQWLESVEAEDGLSRSLIRYETEPGQWTEAFVLGPRDRTSSEKLPGVVVFHSTVENSLYQSVGLIGPNSSDSTNTAELRKAYALHLARRGYVTVSPRNFLWPDSVGIEAQAEAAKFQQRQPQRKGMARMLLDCIRAVDVLLTLEGVDPERIGAIGHSLGAKEVLYLAAFDSRVKAIVSSEGGLGIGQSNWDAPWYLSAECLAPTFKLNHHQLLAAVPPRAFLLIGGEASDGTASLPYLRQAQRAYLAAGVPKNLGFYNHQQGHEVTELSLQRSLEWIDWHLKE